MKNVTITPATEANAAVNAAETAAETRTYKARPETEISTKIGIGVAKSYDNPAIAASRKVRRGCTVYNVTAGETAENARYYESVCKAFIGEGINLNGHIPFRGSLRKEPKGSLPYIVRGVDGKELARFIFTDTERVTAAKAEEPKAEEPKAEAPQAEAPQAEAPQAEAPQAEAPQAEAPQPAKGKGRKK